MSEAAVADKAGEPAERDEFADLIARAAQRTGPGLVPGLHDRPLERRAFDSAADGTVDGTVDVTSDPTSDPAQGLASPPEIDVLGALAIEYREALLATGQRTARPLKALAPEGLSAPLPPDPMRQAGAMSPGGLYDDLLGPRRIDKVLAGLDTLGANLLFAPAERHDVLRLFAAPNLQRRRTVQIAQLARLEHHASSVDSCLALPEPVADATGQP